MDNCEPSPTVSPAGRRAPAATPGSLLKDPVWLRDMLTRQGEATIARLVGCDRKTVTKWRLYHGIPAAPRGRRRGVPTGRRATDLANLPESLQLIFDRFGVDRGAPTESLLAQRLVSLHRARGQDRVYEQALIDLASACALILEHQLTLRRVA